MISENFLNRKTQRYELEVIEKDFFIFRYFKNIEEDLLEPSKIKYFNKININLVNLIFKFMGLEENKFCMLNLNNKRIAEVNKNLYKEYIFNKFRRLTKFERASSNNLFENNNLKYFKNLLNNNSNDSNLEAFLSYYNNEIVNSTTKLIFVNKNKLIEFNLLNGIRLYSDNNLISEIKVSGQYLVRYKYIPKPPYINSLFLIYLRSLSLLNMSDKLTQPESLINIYFNDIIYYEKNKLFFCLGPDEETIYSFTQGNSKTLNSLFLDKINNLALFGRLLDAEQYNSDVFIFYYTSHNEPKSNTCDIYVINSEMKVEFELKGHESTIKKVFYSDKYPEKDVIFSVDSEYEIRVWKLNSRECVKVFKLPFLIKEVYELFSVRSDMLFLYGNEVSGIILLKEQDITKAFKDLKLSESSIEKKKVVVSCCNLSNKNSFKIYEIATSEDEIKVNESLYKIN